MPRPAPAAALAAAALLLLALPSARAAAAAGASSAPAPAPAEEEAAAAGAWSGYSPALAFEYNSTAQLAASGKLPEAVSNGSLALRLAPLAARAGVTGKYVKKATLNFHNNKRGKHINTPPLVWSQEAAAHAKQWATQQVAKCDGQSWDGWFKHSSGSKFGENLGASMGSMGGSWKAFKAAKQSMKGWYGEIKNWNFGSSSSNGGVTGHFTQMVWKSTTKVGAYVAVKDLGGGKKCVMYVANYHAPGNYVGQYSNNVKKRA